jgi:hypothetical protein
MEAKGTKLWMSPEMLHIFENKKEIFDKKKKIKDIYIFLSKSDVFSMGTSLLQIFTLERFPQLNINRD